MAGVVCATLQRYHANANQILWERSAKLVSEGNLPGCYLFMTYVCDSLGRIFIMIKGSCHYKMNNKESQIEIEKRNKKNVL